MSEWISTSDRMPDNDTTVLVCGLAEGSKKSFVVAERKYDSWFPCGFSGGYDVTMEFEPSHWKPLDAAAPPAMNEQRARKVLGKWIIGNDQLICLDSAVRGHVSSGLNWIPKPPPPKAKGGPDILPVHINGSFTVDEIEAIGWWMRNKGAKT